MGRHDYVLQQVQRRRTTRRRVVLTVVLAATAAVTAVLHVASPAVSISATSSDLGHPVAALLSTAEVGDRPLRWRSAEQTIGTAVTTTWSAVRPISQLTLRSPADLRVRIRGAYLAFSDGSSLAVRPDDAGDVVLSFTERTVAWATLTVTAVDAGTVAVGLSELTFDDGGALPPAGEPVLPHLVGTASSSAPGSDPSALVDAATTLPDNTGSVWRSGPGTSPWVQVAWSAPREVSAVQVYGAADLPGRISAGTLEFSDGSVLPISGVGTTGQPSTVAFMPRVVTSVRLALRADGPVALREVGVFERGVTPPQPAVTTGVVLTPPSAGDCAVPAESNADVDHLRLVCPATGSLVTGRVRLVVAAPPASALSLTAWAARDGADLDGGDTVLDQQTASGAGYAMFDVDSGRLRHGPAVLRVAADRVAAPLYVQLFNQGGVPDRTPDVPQSKGLTLSWSDDFRGPLSITRTGEGAVYAATQPSANGPSEFGDAVFADPASGTPNIGTVGADYLRIRLSDRPAGVPDPFGYNRRYLGGMLASAAVGGPGFSAQSGYFEARILGAPGRGTWPAFWALSTASLVDRASPTGEVDAVELYGHDRAGACFSVHNYLGREDKQVDCRQDVLTDWALHWHTYGVRVTPEGTATYYVDGRQVSVLHGLIATDQPYFFMLNLAAGGGWPIDLSPTGGVSDMYVDYVRVYT